MAYWCHKITLGTLRNIDYSNGWLTPSHYLNQKWLVFRRVLQDSPTGNSIWNTHVNDYYKTLENYTFKIKAWWPQVISWTTADVTLVWFCGIQLQAILQQVPELLVCIMCMKIIRLEIIATSPRDQRINFPYMMQLYFVLIQIIANYILICANAWTEFVIHVE